MGQTCSKAAFGNGTEKVWQNKAVPYKRGIFNKKKENRRESGLKSASEKVK